MGTRQRRQRESQARRQSILHAARTLFWKQGFEATTMPQVARTCELAAGTLYLYFPSKHALYAELLLEGYDKLHDRLQALPAHGHPRPRLTALLGTLLDFAADEPQYFRILFFTLQSEAPGGRQSVLDGEQMRRLLASEQRCKDVARTHLAASPALAARDLDAAVDALWSMLAGVVFFFNGKPDYPRVTRQARQFLLRALLPAAE